MIAKFEGDQLRNEVGFHLQVEQLHFVSLVHHFSSFSAVTIGFDAATYTFNETDGTVSRPVRVSVQGSNTLERDVVVTVQTADGTATGGALFHTQRHCRCVVHDFSTSSYSN